MENHQYIECPLCGSIVPLGETVALGYCEVCLLLIQALSGK